MYFQELPPLPKIYKTNLNKSTGWFELAKEYIQTAPPKDLPWINILSEFKS